MKQAHVVTRNWSHLLWVDVNTGKNEPVENLFQNLISPTRYLGDDSPRISASISDDDISYNNTRSPSPCSSTGSDFSAWPWPSTSSPAASSYHMSESDSDDYSPVCSEVDSDGEFEPLDDDKMTIADSDGPEEENSTRFLAEGIPLCFITLFCISRLYWFTCPPALYSKLYLFVDHIVFLQWYILKYKLIIILLSLRKSNYIKNLNFITKR